MAKITPVITKDLQETVRKNPNIKAVYFDDKGNHYFNKHTVEVHTDNGAGHSKGAKKVDALPGVKQGVLKVTGPDKVTKDKKVNTEYNAVACEMDRDEILEAEVGTRIYSDEEKEEILRAAEEIRKTSAKAPAAKGKTAPAAKGKADDDNEDND